MQPHSSLHGIKPIPKHNSDILLCTDQIKKIFENTVAVDDVCLSIKRGEIFALLGSSGSGKSTLLRILAGLETSSSGSIYLDGENITELPPHLRPINMMFQSYALFPHMSVSQNISFGLKQDHLPRKQIQKRVDEMLSIVHMESHAHKKPQQLSGGQCQRVALARCLAKRPKLLLLDEPMAALDKNLRAQMQLEIVNIIEKVGVTCLMVTHDQEEAMTMADRIGIMKDGWIVQVGTPVDIYETPNSRMTASFIGSVNIFKGEIIEDKADHVYVKSAILPVPLYIGHGLTTALEEREVWVAVRPEKSIISLKEPTENSNWAKGIIDEIAYLGSHSVYHIKLPSGFKILSSMANIERITANPTWNDTVYVSWDEKSCVVLNT